MPPKPPSFDVASPAGKLSIHITRFVNSVFERKLGLLGPSRALYAAVLAAQNGGYSDDEIRLAYWAARCVRGEEWLKNALQGTMPPEIVLRHHGRLNNTTGKDAKRWLDDLLSMAGEMNIVLVHAVWRALPDDMRGGEKSLLERVGINVEER